MEEWKARQQARLDTLTDMKSTGTYMPKASQTETLNYTTQMNGGEMYSVVVSPDEISVRRYQDNTQQVLRLTEFMGHWSGFDSSVYEMHGTSILIQVTALEYYYIAGSVVKFVTEEEVVDFVSPVGNSAVQYPVSYGKKYCWFMEDRQYVEADQLGVEMTVRNAEEIYSRFYDFAPGVVVHQMNCQVIDDAFNIF
eukprot:TRINITY_DN7540_c0_g1_i1.p1 TRINITY_DN7540_c0_g1~~TRINITY_DN7540_c0_g1_i1.p1  ORF type:complete len:211 (-),score=43.76 TRINITY_DN7540_c0_g1_i1:18-602(-)